MRSGPLTAAEDEAWGALSGLPGHAMMWVLILSEMVAFGVILVAFSVARALQPALFAAGQAQLDAALGGVNTLVLVTSGWLAARAVRARAHDHSPRSRLLLVGAMALGLTFVALKLVEYADKIQAGIGLETDTFFTLYFLVTGFHLMHVLLGVVILGAVAVRNTLENLETGTAFWHMVDLIWIVIYPLFYLVR
jgi:nitric oxide reductase NorE protein